MVHAIPSSNFACVGYLAPRVTKGLGASSRPITEYMVAKMVEAMTLVNRGKII